MNKSRLGFWVVNAGVCMLSASAFAGETPFDGMQLKGRTDKENPVGYTVGEPIIFTIRTDGLDAVPTNNNHRVRWERTGDDGKVEKGESKLVVGETCVVTTRLERAGFVRLQAHVVAGSGGYWVQRSGPAPGNEGWDNDKSVFFDGGAGADVDKIALEAFRRTPLPAACRPDDPRRNRFRPDGAGRHSAPGSVHCRGFPCRPARLEVARGLSHGVPEALRRDAAPVAEGASRIDAPGPAHPRNLGKTPAAKGRTPLRASFSTTAA